MSDWDQMYERLKNLGYTEAEILAGKHIYEKLPEIVNQIEGVLEEMVSVIREYLFPFEMMQEAVGEIELVDPVPPLRPDRRCPVKINTKGYHRKPCAVARSMRRVGRK